MDKKNPNRHIEWRDKEIAKLQADLAAKNKEIMRLETARRVAVEKLAAKTNESKQLSIAIENAIDALPRYPGDAKARLCTALRHRDLKKEGAKDE